MNETERDAARYRWLRDNSTSDAYDVNAPAVFMCDNSFNTTGAPLDGSRLDRMLDEAMKLEPAKLLSGGKHS